MQQNFSRMKLNEVNNKYIYIFLSDQSMINYIWFYFLCVENTEVSVAYLSTDKGIMTGWLDSRST